MKRPLLALGLGLMLAGCVTAPVNTVHVGAGGGTLAGGAAWTAQVPPGWNGTLLLYSRGYAPAPGDPSLAPADWRQPLLDAGYALAASNYGSGGWALAEAVPAQRATIAAFTKAYGKPRRVIAWGQSMGGLVTTALAEQDRAGGVFSWNGGVDYAAQLAASGRRPLVEALYRKAGLDLNADLAALATAPRIAADPGAVRYMLAHYTASARPRVPILSVQAVGDGSTSPSLQQAYLDAADPRMAHGLWRGEAGHCGENAATAMAALKVLETRLSSGRWPSAPAGFIAHRPAPMLRPCRRGGPCR
jgi:hypothetical protein